MVNFYNLTEMKLLLFLYPTEQPWGFRCQRTKADSFMEFLFYDKGLFTEVQAKCFVSVHK